MCVCYGYMRGGVPEWHRRIVLAHVHADLRVVLTPDLDVYIERMSSANDDVTGFLWGPAAGGLPVGVPQAALHDFRQRPVGEELELYFADGVGVARAERSMLGVVEMQ